MKYLYLESTDSLTNHPTNLPWDFTIELQKPLVGEWKVALGEIDYTSQNEDLYLFTDICELNHIRDTEQQILRIVQEPCVFQSPYFLDLSRQNIQRIRIFIRNSSFEIPSYDIGRVRLTLMLKPMKAK